MFRDGAWNRSNVAGNDEGALNALSRLDWPSALDRNAASCTLGPEIETSPPDMFGLTAIECATHGSGSMIVLRSSGRCDAPPRPWPPAGTCGLAPLIGGTSTTVGVGGFGQIQRLRPVLIAFASWPPPGDIDLRECSEQCAVSPNSDCAMEGEADLVIWGWMPKIGGDEAGVSLPPRGHVKPDRQIWGVIGGGEASSPTHPMFDMAINGEIGQNGDFAGSGEGGMCGICMRARELVMGHCSGEGGEEEEEVEGNFQEAHIIIMMPQQGHNYQRTGMDHIIMRSSGVPLAGEQEGGGIRVELAGPGGHSHVVTLDRLTPHNVREISSDPVRSCPYNPFFAFDFIFLMECIYAYVPIIRPTRLVSRWCRKSHLGPRLVPLCTSVLHHLLPSTRVSLSHHTGRCLHDACARADSRALPHPYAASV